MAAEEAVLVFVEFPAGAGNKPASPSKNDTEVSLRAPGPDPIAIRREVIFNTADVIFIARNIITLIVIAMGSWGLSDLKQHTSLYQDLGCTYRDGNQHSTYFPAPAAYLVFVLIGTLAFAVDVLTAPKTRSYHLFPNSMRVTMLSDITFGVIFFAISIWAQDFSPCAEQIPVFGSSNLVVCCVSIFKAVLFFVSVILVSAFDGHE